MKMVKNKKLNTAVSEKSLPYAAALAVSLIYYAKIDKEFEKILKNLTEEIPESLGIESLIYIPVGAKVLMPGDKHSEIRKALWLKESITRGGVDGAEIARTMLSLWARGKIVEQPIMSRVSHFTNHAYEEML